MSGRVELLTRLQDRIERTPGLRPVDRQVLKALATFTDFETGKNAHPKIKSLVARARLPKRTVERSLQHLRADGWTVARPWHRHATTYDIVLDRLVAASPELEGSRTAPVVRPPLATLFLRAKVAVKDFLRAKLADKPKSVRQSGAPITYREDLNREGVRTTRAREAPSPSLPGLIGPARPPPIRQARRPDGITNGSVCQHDPRCDRTADCIARTVAEAREEREQKHG